MRYLHTILQSAPVFALLAVLFIESGVVFDPWLPLAAGTTVGVLAGVWALGPLRRNLLEDKEHWALSRPFGGVWFFVILGALAGVGVKVLWPVDQRLVMALGLGFILAIVTCFTVIGIWVYCLERRRGMEIWMWPSGLEFRVPE